MTYLKNFLVGFFIVFFVNYLFPGIDVVNQSKIPHIHGDIVFAAILGFLNSLLYPFMNKVNGNSSILRVSVVTFLLNFLAYALLKLWPFGMYVTNVEGYLSAVLAVSAGSVLLSYAQFRHRRKIQAQQHTHHPHDEYE
ncbi:MAG TPA: hypothetical protein VLE96_05260 [Chlamydiales bacterium]|nr:hypothetical protein [Chlamydiales bacterium]